MKTLSDAFPKPTPISGMTREQLNAELQKGWDSLKARKCHTSEEIDAMLEAEFGMLSNGGDDDA